MLRFILKWKRKVLSSILMLCIDSIVRNWLYYCLEVVVFFCSSNQEWLGKSNDNPMTAAHLMQISLYICSLYGQCQFLQPIVYLRMDVVTCWIQCRTRIKYHVIALYDISSSSSSVWSKLKMISVCVLTLTIGWKLFGLKLI